MKLYSDKIGPVEYFRGIGFGCFFIPYAMGIPRWWPICLLISIAAYWLLGRFMKNEESALREAKNGDPRIVKFVLLFGVLMLTNVGLIRLLQ